MKIVTVETNEQPIIDVVEATVEFTEFDESEGE